MTEKVKLPAATRKNTVHLIENMEKYERQN